MNNNNANDSDQSRTIYVGNIASGTSEDHLYELFLQAGPLEYVKIPIDRASKVAKNFAFICYRHECSVPYAIHLLNEINLQGKRLRVQARNNQIVLKNDFEVGIHSLDPDFEIQNMKETLNNKSLLGSPPPPILNQPLTSYNPYMNPYQDNKNYGKGYGNSQSYDNSRSYGNSYSNSNNYQYNRRPMMIDTYTMNNVQDNFTENYRRRNQESERYQNPNSSEKSYRGSYSNSRPYDSSYRSNDYNISSHRNRPYDKFNDRDRSRY